jgi:hypothetical protein
MADEISSERVLALAATARITLTPDAAIRIANTASPLVWRFATANITLPLETEPLTFINVQHSGQTGE